MVGDPIPPAEAMAPETMKSVPSRATAYPTKPIMSKKMARRMMLRSNKSDPVWGWCRCRDAGPRTRRVRRGRRMMRQETRQLLTIETKREDSKLPQPNS